MRAFKNLPRAKLYNTFHEILLGSIRLIFLNGRSSVRVHELETQLKKYFGVKNIISTSSARMGFHLLLKSFKLRPGDEVLLTPLTVPDMVNAIHILGLRPVFVDVSYENHNINFEDLCRKITFRSKVLLLTHLSGFVPNMEALTELAKNKNIYLVEDISQSYGAKYGRKKLGTFGIASIGSYSMGKMISSFGGGVLLSNDDDISKYIRNKLSTVKYFNRFLMIKISIQYLKFSILTNSIIFNVAVIKILKILVRVNYGEYKELHKIKKKESSFDYYVDEPKLLEKMPKESYARLTNIQAELATKSFLRLEAAITKIRVLTKTFFINLDNEVKPFVIYFDSDKIKPVYWHLVIYIPPKKQESFRKYCLDRGIDTGSFGLPLCSSLAIFQNFAERTDMAKKVLSDSVFLPLHPSMTEKNMIYLSGVINSYHRNFPNS